MIAWGTGLAPVSAAVQEPIAMTASTASTSPLALTVGHSSVLRFAEAVERASVNDATIADVVVVSPTQLLVQGKQPGSTTLIVWRNGNSQLITITVEQDLEALRQTLKAVLPKETIDVHSASGAIVLSGKASSAAAAGQAMSVAQTYGEKDKVVNLLSVPTHQVLIEVRFAEVDRSLARSLGVDYIVQGNKVTQSGFLSGALTPQVPATPTFSRVINPKDLLLSSTVSHLLELRTGTDISIALSALEEQGLIRILAEPNLIAMSGEKASFLAGGEFPIPVIQSATAGANNAVTIQFKEFGIRLNFEPQVTGEDEIRMFVEPEVSILDFGPAAVRLGGFDIPGLVTRRARTTVEMRSGESLVIGGLLSQMDTRTERRVPGLGRVPIFGKLFSSEAFNNEETELLVVVTPRLTTPHTLDVPPAFPEPAAISDALKGHVAPPPYPEARGDAIRGAIEGIRLQPEADAPTTGAPDSAVKNNANKKSRRSLFTTPQRKPPEKHAPAPAAESSNTTKSYQPFTSKEENPHPQLFGPLSPPQ